MKRAGTPIGLLRIATVARRAGYDVQIIDAPFAGWFQEHRLVQVDQGKLIRYGLSDAQLREIIETAQPDIVGIQCNYTVQWGNARALADLVKSIDPNLVLVTGGAHSSGDWKNAQLDSAFDFTLINEADLAFTLLLDALTHERHGHRCRAWGGLPGQPCATGSPHTEIQLPEHRPEAPKPR